MRANLSLDLPEAVCSLSFLLPFECFIATDHNLFVRMVKNQLLKSKFLARSLINKGIWIVFSTI